jgi:hypothetical protein
VSRALWWILPQVIVLCAPSLSRAEEPSDLLVLVSVSARPEERSVLIEALREPIDSLGLTLRVAHADDAPPSWGPSALGIRARVWIDSRPVDHVDIFVWTPPGSSAAPAHRSIARSGSSAVIAEEVAYVVRATLESLLSEPEPVAPPPPVIFVAPVPVVDVSPSPPPPAAPMEKTSDRFGFDLSAFAAAEGVASSTAAFGGGLGLDFAFLGARPLRPTLWFGTSINAPVESVTPEASLDTTLYSVRAVPGIELLQFGHFRIAAGAGVGFDLMRTVPGQGSMPSRVTLSSATTQVDPVLEAQLMFHAPIARNVGIVLGLNLDCDVGPHQYIETDEAGMMSTVFAPWALRPSAILGLCLPLAGESPCSGPP